jgi:hypothetical protein
MLRGRYVSMYHVFPLLVCIYIFMHIYIYGRMFLHIAFGDTFRTFEGTSTSKNFFYCK